MSSIATVTTASSSNSEITETSQTCSDIGNNTINDGSWTLDEGHASVSNEDDNGFMNTLAMFYLQMQAKMLLPNSVIQKIIEEFQEVHSYSTSHLLSTLHDDLLKLNMSKDDVKDLINNLSKNDLLRRCNEGVFRSEHTRKCFFKSNFSYVDPTQIYLGIDVNGKERFCQYVSIKDTLQILLSQTSVQEQYFQAKADKIETREVLEDLTDGKLIKNNKLLQESPSSISIILYQDSFQVANPLGERNIRF